LLFRSARRQMNSAIATPTPCPAAAEVGHHDRDQRTLGSVSQRKGDRATRHGRRSELGSLRHRRWVCHHGRTTEARNTWSAPVRQPSNSCRSDSSVSHAAMCNDLWWPSSAGFCCACFIRHLTPTCHEGCSFRAGHARSARVARRQSAMPPGKGSRDCVARADTPLSVYQPGAAGSARSNPGTRMLSSALPP